MDDLAEAALVDARNVPVNGDDAAEVDGFGFLIVLVEDFQLWVIDD